MFVVGDDGVQAELGLRLVEGGLGTGDEQGRIGGLDVDREELAHLVGAVRKRDRVAGVRWVRRKRGDLGLGLNVHAAAVDPGGTLLVARDWSTSVNVNTRWAAGLTSAPGEETFDMEQGSRDYFARQRRPLLRNVREHPAQVLRGADVGAAPARVVAEAGRPELVDPADLEDCVGPFVGDCRAPGHAG